MPVTTPVKQTWDDDPFIRIETEMTKKLTFSGNKSEEVSGTITVTNKGRVDISKLHLYVGLGESERFWDVQLVDHETTSQDDKKYTIDNLYAENKKDHPNAWTQTFKWYIDKSMRRVRSRDFDVQVYITPTYRVSYVLSSDDTMASKDYGATETIKLTGT